MDQPREVHTQKWKLRVGDRVDQMPHEMLPIGADLVVFSAEGDHAHFAPLTRDFGYSITMQSRAVNQEAGFELACGGLRDPAGAVTPRAREPRVCDHLNAPL